MIVVFLIVKIKGLKMSRRGDNIHKRKDGRWEGRIIKDRTIQGKAIYYSVYGKTYKEVKQKLSNLSNEYAMKNINIRNKDVIVFSDVLQGWMNSCSIKIRGATKYKYQYLIDKHIAPEMGNCDVSKITAMDINCFLDRKFVNGRLDGEGGLSTAYVKSMRHIVCSALQWAVNENYCSHIKNPIFKPESEKSELHILTLQQQKTLEGYLSDNFSATAVGILVSLHTGLRIGEVCALKWADIDLKNDIIHIRSTVTRQPTADGSEIAIGKPKTRSSLRDIPISTYLKGKLLQAKEYAVSAYVASDKRGFISPRTYEYRYSQILNSCHIPHINYHALRHTFATRCIEAGVDIKSLSEILGHSNVSITLNTYVHSSMDLKRRQIEKLTI